MSKPKKATHKTKHLTKAQKVILSNIELMHQKQQALLFSTRNIYASCRESAFQEAVKLIRDVIDGALLVYYQQYFMVSAVGDEKSLREARLLAYEKFLVERADVMKLLNSADEPFPGAWKPADEEAFLKEIAGQKAKHVKPKSKSKKV